MKPARVCELQRLAFSQNHCNAPETTYKTGRKGARRTKRADALACRHARADKARDGACYSGLSPTSMRCALAVAAPRTVI